MPKCTLHDFLDDETEECRKCKDQSNAEGAKIGNFSTRKTLIVMRTEIRTFHKE